MNHSIARFLILVALVLTGGTLPVTALAGFVTFTQRSAFDAALVALPGTIKVSSESFDAHGPGLTIADGASLSGLTYSYGGSGNNLAGSGVLMQVSTGFETTSPSNYLGTSDGGVLQSGDDFTLSFRPARAVGMYFISNDPLFDGDITLSSGGTAASLVAALRASGREGLLSRTDQ